MKTTALTHLAFGLLVLFCSLAPLPLLPQTVAAQEDASGPAEKYSREELAQMLAPVALYPDTILTQVLMAATYPIEVVEADRWLRKNPGLKEERLDSALLDKEWSPSVKALCHLPAILAMMSERISETTSLGNAFLGQEAEVLGMVQELRAQARTQGNLISTPQQQVIVERETIIIEPVSPTVIYLPYYDPFRVYGRWRYPAYPPYYWGPPGASLGVGISYWPGIYFSFVFGNWCYFDWHRHYIHIDTHRRPRFVRHDHWYPRPGPWRHDPRHRRGVAYFDEPTAQRFGQPYHRSGDSRRDLRGVPRQGDMERARQDDERTRIDRVRREREQVELERQKRERLDRELKEKRATGEAESRERHRGENTAEKPAGIDNGKKSRSGPAPDKQGRERAQQEKRDQERQRLEAERTKHEAMERARQAEPPPLRQSPRPPAEDKQKLERAEREARERQRLEHGKGKLDLDPNPSSSPDAKEERELQRNDRDRGGWPGRGRDFRGNDRQEE